jgi:uncharacterized membrane protein YtjA (UPF0391 family)
MFREGFWRNKRAPSPLPFSNGGATMLYWTLVFLVVALIAGALGFTGLASASAGVARIIFGVFLVFFLVSLVMQLLGTT